MIDVTNAVEMKIRFVTSKTLYKYKLLPVDDSGAIQGLGVYRGDGSCI